MPGIRLEKRRSAPVSDLGDVAPACILSGNGSNDDR
jgi:hypothetical protein